MSLPQHEARGGFITIFHQIKGAFQSCNLIFTLHYFLRPRKPDTTINCEVPWVMRLGFRDVDIRTLESVKSVILPSFAPDFDMKPFGAGMLFAAFLRILMLGPPPHTLSSHLNRPYPPPAAPLPAWPGSPLLSFLLA